MELEVFGYSHETTLVDERVTLRIALELLRNQQNLTEEPENYIGFNIPQTNGIIQFVRIDLHRWILDIPYYEQGEFTHAKSVETTTRVVYDLVSLFFNKDSSIYQYLLSENYALLESEIESQYNLHLTLAND